MKKFKVGLIVDDGPLNHNIIQLIQLCKRSLVFEISLIIVQKRNRVKFYELIKRIILDKNFRSNSLRALTLKLILKCETTTFLKRYKLQNSPVKEKEENINYNRIELSPRVSKNGSVYRYDNKDIQKIKNQNVDILVRCGSGILKGEILDLCKHGVISFHHGDNRVNRGGPPGFWEVYNREESTGFTIQILNEELDGGDIVTRGNIPTSFLYGLNRARIYKKANIFMYKALENILGNENYSFLDKTPYYRPLYRLPSVLTQAHYCIKTCVILADKAINKIMGRHLRWNVGYFFCDDWKDTVFWKATRIKNPYNRFFADPFIYNHRGNNFCFVEDYSYSKNKGEISVLKIFNEGHQFLGKVLSEDFHLSFPFIIEDKNDIYLVPETHQKQEIRIYKSLDFPLNWKLEKVLLRNISAVDTVIFKKNGVWWLLTNIDSSNSGDHCSELHIYYSKKLISSNWTPHRNNPIIFDSNRARNAGLIKKGDDIYRIFQTQSWSFYGKKFGVAKIEKIDEYEYEEKLYVNISPDFFKDALGTHTFDFKNNLSVFDFVTIEDIKK